ncbi:MAG: sigma-70 family RNA polymerase sigma factor [Nitriliruptorales bacterium]|nr:sigma-70 family RNA polymerase sigma factor [Nitriliruptorales bacterium]
MTPRVSDEELDRYARAARGGDGAAFEIACRALADDVWRYCLALLGDQDLAVEAAQETFLRLVTAVRRYRGDGPFRVYTLVVARRAIAETLRRERRQRDRTAPDAEPDRILADASGLVELEQLVAALPEPLRQAFVLTQVLGLPYERAADVAGCPVGTIRSRVFRARERLAAALQHTDVDEEPRR